MKTRILNFFLILCTLQAAYTGGLLAQSTGGGGTNPAAVGIQGFWEIELQGGSFLVRLSTISSVSQHQYVVDGAARVFEVTVDTTGSQTARFYYIEAVAEGSPLAMGKNAIDRLRSVAEGVTSRTGTDEVWTQVVKNYPTTTHVRTAEYRVDNKAVLDKIYKHVRRVWAEEKGRGKSNKLRIVSEKK
ncbi:MAG: hypothetical protein L3J39_00520 [Verrucomicrobiales bacterium]|nr:hypothetical protein [Verrucomicrobiales bacterium]